MLKILSSLALAAQCEVQTTKQMLTAIQFKDKLVFSIAELVSFMAFDGCSVPFKPAKATNKKSCVS